MYMIFYIYIQSTKVYLKNGSSKIDKKLDVPTNQ